MQEINYEYYVSPEVAKLLKKAGFNLEVNHSYPDVGTLDNSCSGYMEDLPFYHNLNDGKYGGLSVPTLEVAQRWLREVMNISVEISSTRYSEWEYAIRKINQLNNKDNTILVLTACRFYTYEEAQESGIKRALEIILEL